MMDLEVLSGDVRQVILDCAEEERSSEMCGVVVFNYDDFEFLHLKNVVDRPFETFGISADAWLAAERAGEVAAVVHSHPAGEPLLSGTDRQVQIHTDLPWILVTTGRLKLFRCAPHLCGRQFEYGKADCFTLVRDAFRLAGIDFRGHERTNIDCDAAADPFVRNLPDGGFSRVSDGTLQAGDVILAATGGHASHAMLYLGGDWILHHAYNQLNCRVPYTDYWAHVTHSVWRHRDWQPEIIAAIENDLLHRVDPWSSSIYTVALENTAVVFFCTLKPLLRYCTHCLPKSKG